MPIEEVAPGNPRFSKPHRRTISLRWLLAFVFGGLLTISIVGVIAVSVGANVSNTFALLKASSVRTLNGIENTIRDQIFQAERTALSVSELYKENGFELGNMQQQETYLKSLMRAAPIVEGLLVFDLDGQKTGMLRKNDGSFVTFYGNKQEPERILKAFAVSSDRDMVKAIHGDLVEYNGRFYQGISYSLVRGKKIEGVVVALIGTDAINRVIEKIGEDIDTPVFLLEGNSNVIAYSKMPELFSDVLSIPLATFPDELMRELATAKILEDMDLGDTNSLQVLTNDGQDNQIFILKKIAASENFNLSLGVHFYKSDLKAEVKRIVGSAFVGLGMLAVALLCAIYLGRKLANPMTRIARAADHFSNFELEKFERLPQSRIREINDQAKALNSMHTALSEFSQYVPKTVVQRLLQSGKDANRSVEREVTIMFSDIAGFTSMSEHLNAVETANLLNDHFNMICHAINETNGTVDKFIGDCVMAFWGAPNFDDAHANQAVEAVKRISDSLSQNNKQRVAEGLPPIRLRIGIHTGRVVVGNIGGGDRQNYTIVGDNVNVGQRLEQLGKQFMGERDIIVLLSQTTIAAIDNDQNFEPIGSHMLRGRERPISVFALRTDSEPIMPIGSQSASETA
ncbi:MAG: adenylate/guanylate cyclase domain-containing protein [Rhizobiaceae bacterium]